MTKETRALLLTTALSVLVTSAASCTVQELSGCINGLQGIYGFLVPDWSIYPVLPVYMGTLCKKLNETQACFDGHGCTLNLTSSQSIGSNHMQKTTGSNTGIYIRLPLLQSMCYHDQTKGMGDFDSLNDCLHGDPSLLTNFTEPCKTELDSYKTEDSSVFSEVNSDSPICPAQSLFLACLYNTTTLCGRQQSGTSVWLLYTQLVLTLVTINHIPEDCDKPGTPEVTTLANDTLGMNMTEVYMTTVESVVVTPKAVSGRNGGISHHCNSRRLVIAVSILACSLVY